MNSEKFCLRWNDFESNISDAFRELREEKDFFDVTLACDDSQIEAHKVIISACSPFFRNVLRRNPHQHPLLYLKGVKYKELLSVLNFMYLGEVNIAQEELNTFLAIAEDLKVKGLTQKDSEKSKENVKGVIAHKEPPPKKTNPAPKHPRTIPSVPKDSYNIEEDDDVQEVISVKTEPHEPPAVHTSPISGAHAKYQQMEQKNHTQYHQVEQDDHTKYQQVEQEDFLEPGTVALDESYTADEGYEYQYDECYDNTNTMTPVSLGTNSHNADALAQRDADIASNILKDPSQGSSFICLICQFKASSRHKLFCHIESKHFQDPSITYSCPLCEKTTPSRSALGKHVSRNHKGEARNSIFPKEQC